MSERQPPPVSTPEHLVIDSALLFRPPRHIAYEAWKGDEYLVEEIKHQLDSGLLYLDPYLRQHLGSGSRYVDAFIRTLLVSHPVLRSSVTEGLNQKGLLLRDFTGRKLSKIRRLLFLLVKIYLPAAYPWLLRRYPFTGKMSRHRFIRAGLALLDLANFLSFLRGGQFPSLVDRFLWIGYFQKSTAFDNSVVSGPSLRNALWTSLSSALLAIISILPWRCAFLFFRVLFRNVVRRKQSPSSFARSSPEPCGACDMPLNHPVRLACLHKLCYFCAETSCRWPLFSVEFCPLCVRFQRSSTVL